MGNKDLSVRSLVSQKNLARHYFAAGILWVVFLLLSVGEVHAQTSYSWNESASSGSFSVAANWLPTSGPPGSADNVIAPTQLGICRLPTVSTSVNNWTYSTASGSWIVTSQTNASATFNISGTLTEDDGGTATTAGNEMIFEDGGSSSGFLLTLSVGALAVNNGRFYPGGASVIHSFTVNGLTTIGGSGSTDNATSRIQLALDTVAGNGANFAGGVSFGSGNSSNFAEDLFFNATSTSTGASVGSLSGGYTAAGAPYNAAVIASGGSAAISTLTLIGNDSGVDSYGGSIADTTTGTVRTAIVKTGTDTQIFGGSNNTYTGGTTISGGNLQINNSSNSALGTGAVTLNGGTSTTLSGTGSASGLVTVTAGSRIAPGINTTDADSSGHYNFGAAGKLSLGTTGGLTLTSANLDLDLSGSSALAASNDYIATGGALTLTAVTVNINELGGTLLTGTQYAIITGATSVTNFAVSDFTTNFVNGGTTYTPTYSEDGTNINVSFAAVTSTPEPSTVAVMGIAAFGMLGRRRRSIARVRNR